MNKFLKISILIAIIAMLLFAASCGQQQQQQQSLLPETEGVSLKFETIEVNEFMKHPQATTDDEGLRYTISFTYPSEYGDKAVLEALQRKFITHVFGKKHASLTPEAAVNACIEDWKKEYSAKYLTCEYRHTYAVLFVDDISLLMEDYGSESVIDIDGRCADGAGYASHLFNLQTGEVIDEGSPLEDLLKLYPNYTIEVYFDETATYKYTSIEDILEDYAKNNYPDAKEWVIFVPLNPDGAGANINFSISLKDLDNPATCKKESTIQMINYY
jgi:hypothetical protein